MATKKNVKVRDLKPNKDAKGGGGHTQAGNHPIHGASGGAPRGGANTGGPAHTQAGGSPRGGAV